MSWCPSWSNSLWQGWSCGLVHCSGGNTTDLIWRVLASSWTPLKPQHSNPNPLANQLWCIDFVTPPTPLIIPHRLLKCPHIQIAFFEIHQLWQSGFSWVYSNCYCGCSFEAEIIKISQSSHKMYSNKIVNFQESTTILNASTKKSGKLSYAPHSRGIKALLPFPRASVRKWTE